MKAECEMKSLVRWDDPSTGSGRRAQVRAELDACYARLYGLTRDELRYTPLAWTPKKSTARTLRQARPGSQGRFPWRDVPRAEREGSPLVWGRYASDVKAGRRWRRGMVRVKDEGGMMKDENRREMS